MNRRRLWRIDKAGSLERLRLQEEELAAPGPGEARVAVRSVGLNFADVFACLGLYSATPKGPFTPGLEFSGVVEQLGPGTDGGGVREGDRVIGLTRFGGYATHLNAGAAYLRPIPDGWSFAEAAAFPAQALTAWYASRTLGDLREGQAVLIHSAAGGVGLHCVRLALATGAYPVCTVGREEKVDFLIDRFGLGQDRIIVRDPERFAADLDRVLGALGKEGFELILDAVDGPYFWPGYHRLARGGRLVLFGAADLMPPGSRPNWLRLGWKYLRRPRLDPLEMIAENRSLMAFNLIWLWDRVEELERLYGETMEVLHDPPFVGRSFPFEEAPAALRYLQSGQSIGKVVLEVTQASCP